MKYYIDKDALIAEIESIESSALCEYKSNKSRYAEGILDVVHRIKHLIYTLEVKEVDLDKEFDKCCKNYIFDDECEVYTARHFFELGIKIAHKGE